MEIQNNDKYPQVLKDWAIRLEGNRKQPTTIESYVKWTAFYLRFMKWTKYRSNKLTPEEVDISKLSNQLFKKIEVSDVEKYKLYLVKNQKNTGTSINAKLGSLETFYYYLKTEKLIDENILLVVKKVEQDVKQKKPISLENARALLKAIIAKNDRFSIRDYTIVDIMVDIGFRKSEVCNLTMSQIIDMKKVRFFGKGNVEREIQFNDDTIPVLEKYLMYRKTFMESHGYVSDYVFLNASGNKIKELGTILKKYTDIIDLKGCTCHTLRRTSATLRHKYGKVDIKSLQKMLGHASILTTQRYVELDDEEMKIVANSLPKLF